MKLYAGHKLIMAKPMTRKEYEEFRGWETPSDEDPNDDGFLIEYLDGGRGKHPDFAGYISWSPNKVFRNAYRTSGSMTFGNAIELLKRGRRMARTGWNGKNMFIFLVNGSRFEVNRPPLLGIYPEGKVIDYRDHIDMKTADGSVVPWVASQTDILAEDWEIVDES